MLKKLLLNNMVCSHNLGIVFNSSFSYKTEENIVFSFTVGILFLLLFFVESKPYGFHSDTPADLN